MQNLLKVRQVTGDVGATVTRGSCHAHAHEHAHACARARATSVQSSRSRLAMSMTATVVEAVHKPLYFNHAMCIFLPLRTCFAVSTQTLHHRKCSLSTTRSHFRPACRQGVLLQNLHRLDMLGTSIQPCNATASHYLLQLCAHQHK